MKTQGIGRTLRVERETRRVSLDTIARATMVRRDYLELIDDDRLHALPPGAYAKGFIRAYASYLGLDPKPFVAAYEQQCDQPAPELSAVVRHPVRVPNAAQPRAWRLAAAAAVGMLLLLGILGLFRSEEPEPPPPTISPESLAMMATPGPNPLGAVVRIEATEGRSWVGCEADGEILFNGTLEQGQEQLCRAQEDLVVSLGNPAAVELTANGNLLGSPPGPGAYRARFTPATSELPPSELGE